MLMPQELRKYAFTHAIRGYSTAEVDEYIEFLCERYEEIYRENNELTRKLEAALRALDSAKSKEEKITALDAEVKRVSARMLAQAEAQKKRIVTDAEEYADRIIADADAHVAEQAQVLENMRQAVLAFRDDLYSRYSRQIDEIEAFAAAAQAVGGMHTFPDAAAENVVLPAVHAVEAEAAEEPEVIEEITEAEEIETIEEITEAEEIEVIEEITEDSVSDPVEEAEESIESLFSSAEDRDEPAEEADEVDEDEVAATDEVLLFFDSITPKSEDETEVYAEVDADVYELAQQHKAETEFSYDEDEADTDELEELLPALTEDDVTEEEEAVPDETADESADVFPDEDEDGDSDKDLLKNLREAFDIQFETFTTESGEKDADGDFRFLEEEEEEDEEPSGLLERLKNAMEVGKSSDKNKMESREKETRR